MKSIFLEDNFISKFEMFLEELRGFIFLENGIKIFANSFSMSVLSIYLPKNFWDIEIITPEN